MPEIAVEVRNQASTLARRRDGIQYVRYSTIPGKNPASATPSENRSQ